MTLVFKTVIIVVVCTLVALLVNVVSPAGIALVGNWNIDEGVISAGGKNDVVEHSLEITSVDEAHKIYTKKNTLFIDARSQEDFKTGHIQGAVSLPVNTFYDIIDNFIAAHPPEQPIVTYCSGRTCDDSHELAQYLKSEGYENVRVFIDGYPAWKKRGLPVAHD